MFVPDDWLMLYLKRSIFCWEGRVSIGKVEFSLVIWFFELIEMMDRFQTITETKNKK